MATYLVAGATGNVGSACARFLLSSGAKVRCLVRDVNSEKSLALKALGAELAAGDFHDAASLSAALDGAAAALLACSNQLKQVDLETNFIRAAASSATCQYCVKLSTCGCPGYCDLDSAIVYGRWHAAIEASLEAVEVESLAWTVLQPNDFMQNHLGDIFGSLPYKTLAYPRTAEQLASGGARIVDTRDVGEVAARLLLLDDRSAHHGKKYHVCGPASWSVRGLAGLYESALELPTGSIHCVEGMSESSFADNLERLDCSAFPCWLAVAVARNHMFWAEGKLDYGSSDAVLALHPTWRTMEAWVAEHAPRVRFASN